MVQHSRSPLRRSLVFCLAERLGRLPFSRLLREFDTFPAAYAAGPEALGRYLSPPLLEFVFGQAGERAVERELDRAQALGVTLLADGSPEWPENLVRVPGRPPVLYVRGDPGVVARTACVAIVGTRRATRYGEKLARSISCELAARGVVIASGLAMGIDAAAHAGALAGCPGATVAVLGNGVDRITPRVNEALGLDILASGGAVVSEFPLGTPGRRENFPRRNRVIAGLALGVLVVEADEKSGAFHTVQAALDQDRQVMAVPGPVDSSRSAGTNDLLRQGAHATRHAADVLESVGLEELAATRDRAASPGGNLPADQSEVLEVLRGGPRHVDLLMELTGRPLEELVVLLTELELRGMVSREGAEYELA